MTDPESSAVAHAVEAFESALAAGADADLARFTPGPDHPARVQILIELIRVDLERGWWAGQPIELDEYRRRFPDAVTPGTLPELAFEEYRLRRSAGQPIPPAEYHAKYGIDVSGWELFPAGSLAVRYQPRPVPPSDPGTAVLARPRAAAPGHPATLQLGRGSDRPSAPDPSAPGAADGDLPALLRRSVERLRATDPVAANNILTLQSLFPKPGTEFLGFRLVEELGRGAFGRVYLARQSDLSERPVALKVACDVVAESRNLAQLQHTNIMPVYSYHRSDVFQAVCMPYFGRVTLADLLRAFKKTSTLPQSGKELRSIVAESAGQAGAVAGPALPREPVAATDWARMEGWDYVRAVVWFGAQLAEGLAHAHARGILHRDLKPANVLLTDDGRPMILDFNLADDVKLRGTTEVAVGGTLLYMSPEQLRAFAGHPIQLDRRSDVYALGVILFELLTGRLPFHVLEYTDDISLIEMATERDGPPPSVRAANPVVPWAVDAIVRKCLAPKPGDRYQTASDLREDLDRELADQPLAFALNPSARERCRKWVRRHPTVTSTGTVATVAAMLLAVGLGGWWVSRDHARSLEARERYSEHQVAFREAQAFADDRNNTLARAAEGQAKLLVVLRRYGQGDEADPPALEARDDVVRLPGDDSRRLRDDLGESYFLLANLALERALVPGTSDKGRHLSDADRWNRAAERFGERIPRAVLRQRVTLAELRGDAAAARAAAAALSSTSGDTARDHYLSAYGLFRAGRYAEALPGLRAATQHDPENFSAWFVRGQAHLELEQPELAALCFGSCTALRKEFAPAWLNRGLAYARLRFFDQARDDYDRAIALRPHWSEAYLQRATVASQLGDFAAAERDLTAALDCGDATPRLFFLRASVRDRLGNADGATADRAVGLARTPTDELSWIARGEVRMASDPTAALGDVDQALRLNPLSAPALQLKAHLLSERLGRPDDAEQVLDQVVTAYPDAAVFRAGRGVLLARRGKSEPARRDARDALLRDGKPPNLYQVGCIFALTSGDRAEDRTEAIRLVWQALKAGYGLEYVDSDPDLNPIRTDPEFLRVVSAAKSLHGRNPP